MSVRRVQANESDAGMEERIAEYLRLHPDFFGRHPDLAARLEIPHPCGDAVSLIEYQVSVLRDHNHQLRHRLQDLINHARDNEDLNGRLQRLTLSLIDCSDLEEVLATLYESLRESFHADRAAIRLFSPPCTNSANLVCSSARGGENSRMVARSAWKLSRSDS